MMGLVFAAGLSSVSAALAFAPSNAQADNSHLASIAEGGAHAPQAVHSGSSVSELWHEPLPASAVSFDVGAMRPTLARADQPTSEPTVIFDPSDGQDGDAPTARAIPAKNYRLGTLADHGGAAWLQVGGAAAVISAVGLLNWDWGSSSFHFKSEGFFGDSTSNLGLDKLGHAYSTYVLTDLLTSAIRRKASDPAGNAISAGILAMGLMTYVEVFDGFSEGHGFSWEDLVADAAGMAFSVLRSSVPGMKDKLDFRLHYLPPDSKSGHQQYLGQRYILALQLGGFEGLKKTPLRYVELQTGYRAKGFTAEERARGETPKRILFAGIGLNLQELLFPRPKRRWQRWGRELLDYVQVPYTAIYSDQLSKD